MKKLCCIDIDGQRLEYLLDIGNRANGCLCIRDQVLSVRLPQGANMTDAEEMILSHKDWIFEKLRQSAQKLRMPKSVQSGEEFSLLGVKRRLVVAESAEYKPPLLEDDKLTIFVSKDMTPADAERLFLRYVNEVCERCVKDAFDRFTKVLQLAPKKVTIKKMKSRWGSCSSNRSISINSDIVCFSQECIDYVVVHELCHLKHMNHGEDFWRLVASCCPDYKTLRERLKH